MSVQGGSAVRLPAPADKLTPKDVFLCLCSQAQSGILLCWGHTSKGVCPFQDFDSYFFIQSLNCRQKKEHFTKSTSPFWLLYSHLCHSHLYPYLPEEKSLFCWKTTSHWIPIQVGLDPTEASWHSCVVDCCYKKTPFPYHIVIYGAQSWVFTCRSPGWQVVTEPYKSDGFKPLPISCLNASGDRLCLRSWAKAGAWTTALPFLMNREKNNSNEQFARLDKLSSCKFLNEITFPMSFQFTLLFCEQTCHTF